MKYKEKRSNEISMKEIRPEMIGAGLDNVCYHFNNKTICLHSDIEYGLPDSLVIHLITNFNCLAMKKLIVTDFPISEEPEDWTGLLEGDKYVIEEVPAGLAENDISQSIAVEEFLKKHKKPFKVKDNSKQLAHIKMIKAADVVLGFPSVNILEPYVKLIDGYNKNFIIAVMVSSVTFSSKQAIRKPSATLKTFLPSITVSSILLESKMPKSSITWNNKSSGVLSSLILSERILKRSASYLSGL